MSQKVQNTDKEIEIIFFKEPNRSFIVEKYNNWNKKKRSLKGLNNRFELEEESEILRSIKIFHTEKEKEQKINKINRASENYETSSEWTNTGIIGVPDREGKRSRKDTWRN